jgi:ATP/ADP translocase
MFDISSQVVANLPSLHDALLIGRGGAVVLAASAVATSSQMTPVSDEAPTWSALAIAGGAATLPANTSLFTPEGKSVLFMAIAMAFHYLGYSLARSITVSLFTSSSTGYAGSAAAFPFAMAFVSPCALLMLMGYNNVLERKGPRGALMQSTVFCAIVVNAAALAIATCLKTGLMVAGIPAVKLITGPLFIFRESYVQLLTSQYWSFMASALTPNQSAKWFGPIAGLTSCSSAVAGYAVSPLVRRIGLTGALMGTGTMLLLSLVAASVAYDIARKHGFEPTDVNKSKERSKKIASPELHKMGMIEKAARLFKRVPVLKALFMEILASQGLATVLNVCFVTRLGSAIPNDDERAGWVGKFFAIINIITMILQFGVLPPLMTVIEPRQLWRVIPIVSLLFTGFQVFQRNPSLYLVSASLLVMKVCEYSARRMLDEMIFVPLDFESRFVGKEVIGVFGYRFGKSLMSLLLSGITYVDANFGLQKLSILSNLVCFAWMQTAWTLSNMVPTREEAEAAHKKGKQKVR